MSSIDQALDLLRQDRQAHVEAIAKLDTAIAALSGTATAPPAPPTPARTRALRQVAKTNGNGNGTNGHVGAAHATGSLSDRVLALAPGRTAKEVATACEPTRANHVGIALSRHVKAGRLQTRDGRYYPAEQAAA